MALRSFRLVTRNEFAVARTLCNFVVQRKKSIFGLGKAEVCAFSKRRGETKVNCEDGS